MLLTALEVIKRLYYYCESRHISLRSIIKRNTKIMNTINKSILATLILVLVGLVSYAGASDRSMIKAVQSGEASLSCHIGTEPHVVISPEMVKGYDDIRGWIFSNGSAKNCEVTY